MDDFTKTRTTPAPFGEEMSGGRVNSSDARASGGNREGYARSTPGSARGEYQKTVLVNDPADAETVAVGAHARNGRDSGIEDSALPNLNLTSSSLAALSQRYDILSEAGHGNMGNVYKARDRETGEIVALKLIKPQIASDRAITERFKNELLFARKITHKNVCRVYEFNRIGGIAYTSMEFVEGESLRTVLSRFGGLPVRKGVDLALQICSGLKEAHAQGIVHRDLKPENVMIDKQGNVKIMDFGIARSMEAGTRLTGAMIGTPAYMAPEQVSGKPVDYRTDIYALGLVLYEMFTGSETFRADTPVAIALKQMQEAPTPPHDLDPTIPVYIERAILKCLEKEPAKRFQSVAELENALRSTRVTGAAMAGAPLAISGAAAGVGAAALAVQPRAAEMVHAAAPITARAKRKSKLLPVMLLAAAVLLAMGVLRAMNEVKQAAKIKAPEGASAPAPPAYTPVPLTATVKSNAVPTAATTSSAAKSANPFAPPPRMRAQVNAAAPAKPKPAAVFPKVEWGNNVIQPWQARPTPLTFVWVGRFEKEARAQNVARRIEAQNLAADVVPRRNAQGKFFVVLTGPYEKSGAKKVVEWLRAVGFPGAHEIRVGPNGNRGRSQGRRNGAFGQNWR